MTVEAAPDAPIAPPVAPAIDLTVTLEHDAPSIRLPVYLLNPRSLGWGELIRVSELTGYDTDELEGMLARGGSAALRAGEAFAYVLALRTRPDMTWDEMRRHRVEVVGSPAADPTEAPSLNGRSPSPSLPGGPRP